MVDYLTGRRTSLGNRGSKHFEELIGRAPDPVADRQALAEMRDAASPGFHHLVEGLRTREDLRSSRVGALLPGLALLESPRLTDLLGVRAVNAVARANVANWSALAGTTPASVAALSGVGPGTANEILAVAAREWAAAYLREDGSASPPAGPADRRRPPVPGALAAEDRFRNLARAFEDLEQAPGFDVLRRRQFDPGQPPKLTMIAAELGVSPQRASELQATIRRLLARQMRNGDWPIRFAAEEIRERLGAVARTEEIKGALAAIDPDGSAMPAALPHRHMLLLHLAEYRISGEWVLAPDIESLTRVVLDALADSASADLDAVGRHLTRLGVRDELQLPWIVCQLGFQIVDGELRRLVDG
ncbi:MAG: hypothetical protein ACOYD4_10050 [Solirubrobacterales bacterium]